MDAHELETGVDPVSWIPHHSAAQLSAEPGLHESGALWVGNAWQSVVCGEVARLDLPQLAVVALRKVTSDLPELLVHDVEVVEEPFFSECDLALCTDRLDAAVISVEKCAPVVADSRKQIASAAALFRGAIRGGQALGVPLQALGTK